MGYTKIFILALLLICSVSATHFRFGQITWERLPANGSPRRVRFTLSTAWRRTFFGSPDEGDTITESARFFPDENSNDNVQLQMIVNTVNLGEDWVTALQTVEYDYDSDGLFTASFARCCRISTLINNPDGDWRIQTTVAVTTNVFQTSISSAVLPIITAIFNQVSTIALPVSNPNNQDLRFRLADPLVAAEDGDYNQADGLVVNFFTGVITFNAAIRGLHSTQIVIEAYDNSAPLIVSDRGTVPQHSIVIDFILNVIDQTDMRCKRFCANLGSVCTADSQCFNCFDPTNLFNVNGEGQRPHCDPNFAPEIDSITTGDLQNGLNLEVSATAGEEFVLTIVASDQDIEDFIEVTSTALPPGAQFAIANPLSNPVTATLTWTPTLSTGFVICFQAIDSLLNPSLNQVCTSIVVLGGVLEASLNSPVIAGEQEVVSIENINNRDHEVNIVGPMTDISIPDSDLGNGDYEAVYNEPNDLNVFVAGFYVVTVSDITSQSVPDVIIPLTVRPAATSAPDTLAFDRGSNGLSAVMAGSEAFFFIQARDRFLNEIDELRDEGFVANFEYLGESLGSIEADLSVVNNNVVPGEYNVTYTAPITTTAGTVLNIELMLLNTEGVLEPAGTFEVPVLASTFSMSYTLGQVVAGTPVTFDVEFTNALIEPILQVIVFGNVVDPSNIVYGPTSATVNGPIVTQAGGFVGELGVSVFSGGASVSPVQNNLVVVAAPVSGPASLIDGEGTIDAVAGGREFLDIILNDEFGNRILDEIERVFLTVTFPNGEVVETDAIFANGIYVVSYISMQIGFLTLSVTAISEDSEGNMMQQFIEQDSFTVFITPAEFALNSTLNEDEVFGIAGETNLFSVTAMDEFGNMREPRTDSFELAIEQSIDGVVTESNVTIVGDVIDPRYVYSWFTTRSGFYELELNVFLPGVRQFVEFIDMTVRVLPAEGVLENTDVEGDGLEGGISGTTESLFVTTRDRFLNPLESTDDDLFALELFYIDEGFPILPEYVDPLFLRENSFGFKPLQDDEAGTDENDGLEEGPDTGHFRFNYVVPAIRDGFTTFTLNIYHDTLLPTDDPENITAALIMERGTMLMSIDAQAMSPIGFFEENWPWIAGAFAGGAIALSGFGYATFRLYRYKPKYKETRERAESAERALEEIAEEQNIIVASRDWDAVGGATVTANPLHDAYALMRDPREFENVDTGETELVEKRGPIRKEFKPAAPTAK